MNAARPWLAACLFGLTLLLTTACGGGGDGPGTDASTPPPPPPPPTTSTVGDPVTATIGPAGGTIDFTTYGVRGTLSFPAGALAEAKSITVTPLAASAGEWARLTVSGLDAVLERPATLTLTTPDGSALDRGAGVTFQRGGSETLLPGAPDTATRRLSVQVQWFGRGGAAGAPAGTARALGRAQAEPIDVNGVLVFVQSLAVRLRVAIAEAQYVVMVALQDYPSAANLSQSIAALVQSSGLDGYELEARPWLERTGASACASLAGVISAARNAPAPTEFDPDGNVARSYEQRWGGPVMYWAGIVQALGASCPGQDPAAAIGALHEKLLAAVAERLRQRQDLATLKGTVGEAAAARALRDQGATLAANARGGASPQSAAGDAEARRAQLAWRAAVRAASGVAPLHELFVSQFVTPVMGPLRDGVWQGARTNAAPDYYRDVLRLYGSGSPMAGDLQQLGTTLRADSFGAASTAGAPAPLLTQARTGRGATPQLSTAEAVLPVLGATELRIAGPIDTLKCPAAAEERLLVKFAGVLVAERRSSGSLLLSETLTLRTDALLAAAGLTAEAATRHPLTLERVDSQCNASFGIGNAVVSTLTLDFGPADATAREIELVRQQIYLDPSDDNLTRLNSLRSRLSASRAEQLLADSWVSGPLYCAQQVAHGNCASGGSGRGRGEATLGLLKAVSSGSSALEGLHSRASDSLRLCPYPAFANGGVYAAQGASINDRSGPLTWALYLGISQWEGNDIRFFSVQAVDETTTNRERLAAVAVRNASQGPTFVGTVSDGNLSGLAGNRFDLLRFQSGATRPTTSITVNERRATGWVDLFDWTDENEVRHVVTMGIDASVTLPAAPDPATCRRASLPQPE